MLRKVNITNSGILFLIQVNLFVFCHKSNPNYALWTIPVPDVAKTTAVYGEIQNPEDKEISILSIISNQYKRVEFHSMTTDKEGIMRMRKLEFPILMKAKEIIHLDRNGIHLMLYEKQKGEENLYLEIQFSNGVTKKMLVETKSL